MFIRNWRVVCWKTKTFSIVYFGDISITNFVLFYIFELTMKEKRYNVHTYHMGMNLWGHAFPSENVALFDGFGTPEKRSKLFK